MAWNNVPSRSTGDTILAADANALMENLRVLGGNGTATPSSDIETLSNDKADKVSGATNGNIAALDAAGNLVDSGAAVGNLVLRDGTLALTSDWDIGDGIKLRCGAIWARDANGLTLGDSAGNGIVVKNGGLEMPSANGSTTITRDSILNPIDNYDLYVVETFSGDIDTSAFRQLGSAISGTYLWGSPLLIVIRLQYDSTEYHSGAATFLVTPTFWCTTTAAIWYETIEFHEQNNQMAMRFSVANGSRILEWKLGTNITVSSGGKVEAYIKRI